MAETTGKVRILYYFLYFKALEVEAPSVVIALFNLTAALVPFLAYFLLGEVLVFKQYVGVAIIVLTAAALSAVDIKKFKFSKALYLVGIASCIYALVSVASKYVLSNVAFWDGYIFFSLGMGLGAIFFMTVFKEGRRFPYELKTKFKKWIGIFAVAELLNISAEFVQNLAISKGPVSIVKVIEGTLPIFVLVTALLLYRFFPQYLREATHTKKFKKLSLMGIMLVGLWLTHSGSV